MADLTSVLTSVMFSPSSKMFIGAKTGGEGTLGSGTETEPSRCKVGQPPRTSCFTATISPMFPPMYLKHVLIYDFSLFCFYLKKKKELTKTVTTLGQGIWGNLN